MNEKRPSLVGRGEQRVGETAVSFSATKRLTQYLHELWGSQAKGPFCSYDYHLQGSGGFSASVTFRLPGGEVKQVRDTQTHSNRTAAQDAVALLALNSQKRAQVVMREERDEEPVEIPRDPHTEYLAVTQDDFYYQQQYHGQQEEYALPPYMYPAVTDDQPLQFYPPMYHHPYAYGAPQVYPFMPYGHPAFYQY
jgi:hypothetical protein